MRGDMLWAWFLCLALGLPAVADSVTIVERGEPRAAIVLAPDASSQLRAACAEMQSCVRLASGAKLEIVTDRPANLAAIHVGRSEYVAGLKLDLQGLDGDGFVIAFPDARNIVVLGPTDWGTEFGVYEFLERYLGVRWLLPGQAGTDVPQASTIAISTEPVRQTPVFFSRLMSGFSGNGQSTWARRNRMHGRVSFHHNLRQLFPWKVYAQTHPEFYPMIDGKRLVPTRDEGWQPCFTAPGIVDEAVKNIVAFFDRYPDATSYSLGMNDNRNFCQCPECQTRISGEKNFLDRVDYSELYYDWANRVIEGVLKKHPDKYFGCLAYSNLAAPPRKVRLHPRLIPFMTYDRNKWIDPEIRQTGQELTVAWQQQSPTLGWYDYIYGRPYLLPRVWFHHMADYYRWGQAHSVRAMYAEAYPNWGEGPKLYVAFKLQWDPAQDVNRLLNDWYVHCVGERAAASLAKYYAHWEDFWTRRILDSAWFTRAGQYLPFNRDPAYLAELTDAEIAECRSLLETTLAQTQTPQQKARAQVLMDAFEYYECSAIVYRASRVLPDTPHSEKEALAALDSVGRAFAATQKRRHLLETVLPKHALLANIAERPLLRDDCPWMDCLLRIYDWNEERTGPVHDRLRSLAEKHRGSALGEAVELLAAAFKPASDLGQKARNGSFEDLGSGTAARATPRDWSQWIRPKTTAQIEWSSEAARCGKLGLTIRDATAASVIQSVPVQPGEKYLASAFLKGQVGPTARVGLVVKWQDKAGKWLPAADAKSQPLPTGLTQTWIRRSALVKVPEGAARAMLMLSASQQSPEDYACFDDVELKPIPTP